MFNLGWGELVVIFIVVLLVFGAKGIPEIARNLGKSLNAFKRGVKESEEELKRISRDDEESTPAAKQDVPPKKDEQH